jgi:hypothetical protein
MDYTLKIYRLDRRCKSGERLVGSYNYDRKDDAAMDREVNELRLHHYPSSLFRIEYAETYKTVTNLMTGKEIRIAADTPRCCDPSSESYWSM